MVKFSYISTLSLPILAKSPKEVNEISKYFKKNPSSTKKNLMFKCHLTVLTQLEKH